MKQDSASERINFPSFPPIGPDMERSPVPAWAAQVNQFRRASSLQSVNSEDSLAAKPRRSRFSVALKLSSARGRRVAAAARSCVRKYLGRCELADSVLAWGLSLPREIAGIVRVSRLVHFKSGGVFYRRWYAVRATPITAIKPILPAVASPARL